MIVSANGAHKRRPEPDETLNIRTIFPPACLVLFCHISLSVKGYNCNFFQAVVKTYFPLILGLHIMNIFHPLIPLKRLFKQRICFQQCLPKSIRAHGDILKADSAECTAFPGLPTKYFAV